ncbi:MAG: hypothetical protein QM831_37625 [Kofleriaceae bacterium]
MDHTPLDTSRLSPAAQKALGPGPGRMMASRGLVPLPPGDQIAVLYSLSIDADQNLATAARTTAIGLPDKLLGGALADPNVDPRVLDLFAQLVGENPAAFEALVSNGNVADETIAYLAANGGAKEIDRIAGNEQRLLRHPAIIAAMYQNKLARMSTVDRVVELAVRNFVKVPGLAAWDEIAQALQHVKPGQQTAAEADAAFSAALSKDDDTKLTTGDANQVPAEEQADEAKSDRDLPYSKLTIPQKIRLAMVGNAVDRGNAIRDPVKVVAVAAIKAGGVTEFEAAHYAGNPGLVEDVIKYIARKTDWTKAYGTKVALCRNPKTPVTDTMRFMPFLRDKDLAAIVRSKGVPSAVVAQARKLVAQRTGPKK